MTEIYDKTKGHAVTEPDQPIGFRVYGKGDFAKYAVEYNREAEMELITKIRNYEAPPRPDAKPQTLRDAADNLLLAIGMGWDLEGCAENLRAALTRSDAEPVAWQYRVKQGGWGGWHDAVPSREEAELCVELGRKASGGHLDDYEIRPLYTTPPRPDASAEIAELQERCADAQWLACEWMARHDKVVGFISKNYPSVMMPNLPFPSPVSRPDASAGLIEAAEWHEEKAEDCEAGAKRDPGNKIPHLVSAKRHREAAKHFRARAANRSEK